MFYFAFLVLFSASVQAGSNIKLLCPQKAGCFKVVHVLSEAAAQDREALGCQRADGTSPKIEKSTPKGTTIRSRSVK